MRVGLVHWTSNDEVMSLISETLRDLGCQVSDFLFDAKLPDHVDLVMVYGPYGSLVPLSNYLLTCPPAQRPALAVFQSEQLPNPAWPEWVRYALGAMRSGLERVVLRNHRGDVWSTCPQLHRLISKAMRFRYYGDLHWLRQNGLLSVTATASAWTAEFLRARGFRVIATPGFGFPQKMEWGTDLGLERDIPVLWLGTIGSRRRQHHLQQIREALRSRHVEMLVIDGMEHPPVFGVRRTELLNRTKIVLNLLRTKWDENAMRYYLATMNRALVITEPMLPHHPCFAPGQHLIEAPLDSIADTICYYLSHDAERQDIVERAHHLVTTEMTLQRTLSDILQAVAYKPSSKTTETREQIC